MSVSIHQVEKIARLAKLSFSQKENENFTDQFNQILTFMEKLNELDTETVEPTTHMLDLQNAMREDNSKTGLSQDEALDNAPRSKYGFFSVPKVLDKQ